jgi:APA family basic amino acid/polyamine antiporter
MLGTVHPKFRTPHIATMLTGLFICVAAAFTPIYELEEMVNIGTLMAFVIVCAAVLVLRYRYPDAKRPFRCPALSVVAPMGMLVNASLMLFLPIYTWVRLAVWLAIGLLVYFCYSRRHSHLIKHLMHQIKAPDDESIDDENGDAMAPANGPA